MAPIPTEWWLRPVSSACRVGEHSAVVWKRLSFSPPAASRSATGVWHGPPNAEDAPKPTSSMSTIEHIRRAVRRPQLPDRRVLRVRVLGVIGGEPDVFGVRDGGVVRGLDSWHPSISQSRSDGTLSSVTISVSPTVREPTAGLLLDAGVGGAQRPDQPVLAERGEQLALLGVHGAAHVGHAGADLGALVARRAASPATARARVKLTETVIGAVDTVRCACAVPIPLWARMVVGNPQVSGEIRDRVPWPDRHGPGSDHSAARRTVRAARPHRGC